jgi:hypothetical protein
MKERERVVERAAGDECVFIPGEGESSHGAAKVDGVIRRYVFYPLPTSGKVYAKRSYQHCTARGGSQLLLSV